MKKLCCITTVDMTLSAFVVEAMKVFVEKGYDVTLVSSMSQEFIKKNEGTFRCINMTMQRGISIKDMMRMPFLFYKLFKQESFDYVQYATPNASLYASIAARLARVPVRVYCQWGIRYVGFYGVMRFLLKSLEKLTCKLSTHIRPASQKNMDFAVMEGLYKSEKANIIGNGGTIGVDLEKYNIGNREKYREALEKKFPVISGKFVFTFIGRLHKDKGVFELLEAFMKLRKERNDVALMMIGNMEGTLPENLADVRECPDIVFTGNVSSDKIPSYLGGVDCLVHPSYREGFSMVIQEAMACALPVITTNIPGPSEVIEDGISGILVPAKEAEGLRLAMNRLASEPELCKEMGKQGRKRAEQLFNRERMLKLTFEDRIKLLDNE